MLMKEVKAPIYAHRCLLNTKKQTNNYGDFFNFHILPFNGDWVEGLIPSDHELLKKAQNYFTMYQEGSMKVAFETMAQTEDQPAAETNVVEAGKGPKVNEEDIPF